MKREEISGRQGVTEIPKEIHPVKVPGYPGANYDLGRAIVGMRYDQVGEVFRGMLDGLCEQIDKEAKRGRSKLALQLSNVRIYLNLVFLHFERAFRIGRPYMHHELKQGKGVPENRHGETQ